MNGQLCYFVIFFTVNLLSYYIYNPTPPEMEQPCLYATGIVANFKVIEDMAKISNGIGFKDYHVFKQDITSFISKAFAAIFSADGNDVSVAAAIFDGVPVRLYRQSSASHRNQAALVYMHNGGFMQGSSITYDGLLRRLVKDAGIFIVAIDYSLAPQYPSPVALEDCMRATRHVFLQSESLGVDPVRVGVAGDGSGGNLAVSVALSFRDIKNAPKLAYVATIYPWLQALDFNTPSMQQNERYVIPDLTRRGLATLTLLYVNASLRHTETLISNRHVRAVSAAHFRQYIRPSSLPVSLMNDQYSPPNVEDVEDDLELLDIETSILDPLNFPLMADDLGGLPPTLVATMGYDTVRDDGFWLVERLKKDGCSVKHYHDPHGWHGVLSTIDGPLQFDAAERLYREVLSFTKIFS